METINSEFIGIELRPNYLEEFKICGVPIPIYSDHPGFVVLKFKNIESYLNYINVLKLILSDLKLADPENSKYDIQRSKFFIINLLDVMRKKFAEKYN